MLFDQREFEHTIEEPELKKGLKLFAANKLELLNKTSNTSFTFLIHTKPSGEIFLQLKTGKIINYKCFCRNKKYCEHLAACIFYLQKEVFEFISPTAKKEKKQKTIKKHILENCLNKIKLILKPFAEDGKLKTQQINEICKKVYLESENALFMKQEFYFNLAIILELPKISNFNSFDRENKLQNLFNNSIQKIKQHLNGRPTAKEKEAVIEAAKYSVKSQPNFRTGAFSLLICNASVFIKDKNDFEFLKGQLKKRSLNKNRPDQIDRKLIAELELAIMHSKLLNKVYSVKNYASTIELPIALAELEFCRKKNEKGFKILAQNAFELKKKNINAYLDLVEEILNFAKETKDTRIEIEFLQEKFIYGFFIDENELNYFFELNEKKREQAAEQLLMKLKTESLFYTFDKIAVLLLKQNKVNELLEEIKKEKNKFRILNKIASKILPDNDFIKIYIKHLVQAITEAKFPYFQEQVFNLARPYIDNLPIEQRNILLKLLKGKMMYERQFLLFINKLYPEG